MLPLYPPYPFVDLAKEHLGSHQRHARRHHHDLDDLPANLSERQPDPVYPRRRWLVASGPIGNLFAWIDRRFEVQEAGTSDSRTHPIKSASTVTELTMLLSMPIATMSNTNESPQPEARRTVSIDRSRLSPTSSSPEPRRTHADPDAPHFPSPRGI